MGKGGAEIEPNALRRVLGLPQLTASGVGMIIGAGIYVLLGAATAEAGATVWLAFVLAAALSVLTGLSYAELSAMFPRAGGEFEYARRAFPAPVAFLAGWLAAAALLVGAAAIALGFARYLGSFVPVDARAGALGLLLVVALVALSGIERSGAVTVALSVVQIGGLLAVIAIGAPHVGQADLLAGNGAGGVLAAAALVFFAFIGFDEVVTMAEETVNPTWAVPRALLLGLAIATLLYIGVAIAAVSVLGAGPLGASPRPLADVFAHALGRRGGQTAAAVALLTTMNTTLLAVTAGSRVLYGMARSGALPAPLGRVSPRTGAPRLAIAVVALGAAGFAVSGDLTVVASVTDAAVYVVFLVVNAAVVALRFRRPDAARPFATPGALGRLPVLPVLGMAAVALMMLKLSTWSLALGAALTAIGLGVHLLLRHRSVSRA